MYTVYRLENIVTKKNYIGMTSRNPKRRWSSGYNGKMGDAIKQFPFDLCWKKHIEFQTPNKEQALELEAELMKWYDSVENGYNTSTYGGTSYKRTDKTKKKMSESRTGEKNPMFGKHHSEETRKKLSEANTGEKNPMFGKHHSEETKSKMSEALTGEKHPMFGKHFSEEHRRKISEANKGNINIPTKPVLQYSKSGEFIAEYPSIMEASRQTGCNNSHICECCEGKRKSASGFIWRYKEI